MKRSLLILLTVMLSATCSSYAQQNNLLKYVPAGTNRVFFISPSRMAAKFPKDVLLNSKIVSSTVSAEKTNKMEEFLKNPGVTGINLFSDIMITTVVNKNEPDAEPSVAIFGNLLNAKKFDSLVRAENSAGSAILQAGNIHYLVPEGKGMAVAWNQEVFVVSGSKETKKQMAQLFEDTTDSRDFDVRMKEVQAKNSEILKKQCLDLLTVSNADNDLVKKLSAIQQQPGDIRTWSNGVKGSKKGMEKVPPFITAFLSKIQGMTQQEVTGVINFENGKIAGDTRSIPGPEMLAILEKYPTTPLPLNMAAHLPKGKVLFMIMTSSQPEKSKEVMKQMGLEKLTDSLKDLLHVDFSKFTKAFGSQMMFSLMSLDTEDGDAGQGSPLDKLGLFIAMPVKDKALVGEMQGKMNHLIDSLAATEKGEKILNVIRPSLSFNDNLAVLTIRPEAGAQFLENNNPLPKGINENMTGSMLMTMDMGSIMELVASFGAGKGAMPEDAKAIFSKFDQMVMTGGDYKDGAIQGRMEFRFSDPDKNALVQFFEMIDAAASAKKQKGDSMDEAPVEMPPPPGVSKDEAVKEPPSKKTKSPSKKKG